MAGGDAVDCLEGIVRAKLWALSGVPRTYPERLQVIHREGIAVEVEKGILQHAAVAVAGETRCQQHVQSPTMHTP
jgi:hypothetical protein